MLWDKASEKLGGLDAIDLSRELVKSLTCPACGQTEDLFQSVEKLNESAALCKSCGSECSINFIHSISKPDDLMNRRIHEIGLPLWDIIWARYGDKCLGLEIAGDDPNRPSHVNLSNQSGR